MAQLQILIQPDFKSDDQVMGKKSFYFMKLI